ncbi:hypothetical protein ES288_D09G160600v1 [Gossypium darwinii]|uniref:Uncharacterized protein n=1 Tax=Gossypium darwinii TaxID=34276 RepID=A0A5D2BDB2_GOSDA|nr:hypothetical protein ES288_D09G160600v1 [Gossypium darwinii]
MATTAALPWPPVSNPVWRPSILSSNAERKDPSPRLLIRFRRRRGLRQHGRGAPRWCQSMRMRR